MYICDRFSYFILFITQQQQTTQTTEFIICIIL